MKLGTSQCSRLLPYFEVPYQLMSTKVQGPSRGGKGWFRNGGASPLHLVASGILCGSLIVGVLGSSHARGQESLADVLVAEGVLVRDEKQLAKALQLLEEALDLYPDHVEALYYTGLVLLEQNRMDEAIARLEQAHSLEPDNVSIAYQLGVAYFSQKQYDKAQPLLTKVFEESPGTNNVGYYVGFMRYRLKDYQGAIGAFRGGASEDPRILQLTRFYAGLSLAILGLPEQAAGELEEAMRVRTVSPLTGPADRLRDTLVAARKGESRFGGQVRIGAFYDTNVAVIPKSTGEAIIESLRSRKARSSGELASFRFDQTWFREGAVEGTLSYSFFQTYDNDLPAFNVQNHLGALGGFYRTLVWEMPVQAGIQGSFDKTWLGGNNFLDRLSASFFGTVVESSFHLTTVQGRIQIKDFFGGGLAAVDPVFRSAVAEDDRSGTNYMVGFTHLLRFEGDRHLLRGGYQLDTDATLGDNFSYTGHRLQAGGMYTVPWEDIRVRYDYDVHFRIYDHPNTRFSRTGVLPLGAGPEVKQKVTEQTHILRFEKSLPNNLTLALDWQWTFSRSNIDILFDFDRQVLTSSLTWAF